MANLKYPTDFELITLALITSGGNVVFDIKQQLVELSYFEDLFNNTISGKVVLGDAIGILNLGALNGTEFIKITFRKVGSFQNSVDRTFRVFSVTNRKIDKNLNKESYTLEFCSEEFLLSEQYRVCKAYKTKKISEIIKDIFESFLLMSNNKKIYIENTKGTFDFVLPNKKIFETINWLTNYAISDSKNGADMLFFENRNGFNFISLQTLKQNTPKFIFSYNPKNISNSDMLKNLTNILNVELLEYFDTLGALNKGTFGNRVITIDPIFRRKNIVDYNYSEKFKDLVALNQYAVVNNYQNRFQKALYDAPPDTMEAGALRMVVTNSSEDTITLQDGSTLDDRDAVAKDFFIEKSLPSRVSLLSLNAYTRLKITIPGNSDLTVGDIIQLNFDTIMPLNNPSNPSSGSRGQDAYYSGRYIVSAIRHIITPGSYISVAEVCKDSVAGKLPNSKYGASTTLGSVVNGNQ